MKGTPTASHLCGSRWTILFLIILDNGRLDLNGNDFKSLLFSRMKNYPNSPSFATQPFATSLRPLVSPKAKRPCSCNRSDVSQWDRCLFIKPAKITCKNIRNSSSLASATNNIVNKIKVLTEVRGEKVRFVHLRKSIGFSQANNS